MESKKNNYKKPVMQVVEIQYQGHLLVEESPDPSVEPGGLAREQNSNWSSED